MKNVAMQRQLKSALDLFKEVVGNISSAEYQNAVVVSVTQGTLYEEYADQLQQQEQKLVEELHRIVLEYSAKISATRELKAHAIRQSGLNEGMRMAELD